MGKYYVLLGKKGLHIPDNLFSVLQKTGTDELVLTLDDIDCDAGHYRILRLYPMKKWNGETSELSETHLEIEQLLDSRKLGCSGWIYLSKKIRKDLRVDYGDELTINGVRDCIEIWKKADFKEYYENYLKPFAEAQSEQISN